MFIFQGPLIQRAASVCKTVALACRLRNLWPWKKASPLETKGLFSNSRDEWRQLAICYSFLDPVIRHCASICNTVGLSVERSDANLLFSTFSKIPSFSVVPPFERLVGCQSRALGAWKEVIESPRGPEEGNLLETKGLFSSSSDERC